MKTKIFLTFIAIILAALLSNFIFEWLIIRDFDSYINGVREDQFYWTLQKQEIKEKESIFKKRTKNFLYVSFLTAGGGSLLIALLLSQCLSKPVMNLKKAAEKISQRDFSARAAIQSGDEVGKLSESFNKMAEFLQRDEGLRKHLFSNIAHELRTPLTILKTHAEAVSDGVVDRNKGIENIKDEIDKLIKLVKGIEDITAAGAKAALAARQDILNLRG